MEKKPIVRTLRNMQIGESEIFPLTQYNTLRSSKYSGLLKERADGMDWEIIPDLAAKHVKVTRTA